MADLIDRNVAIEHMCGDCKSAYDGHCPHPFGMCRECESIWETPKADLPAANRWIPCSERMPENRERVLVCFRSGTVHIAVWYGDYDEKGAWKVTSQFPTKLYRTDTIPKWMPMPDAYEPPEGGAEDE